MVMELIHLQARPRARYAFVESDAALVNINLSSLLVYCEKRANCAWRALCQIA
jgi:hypothetical protein